MRLQKKAIQRLVFMTAYTGSDAHHHLKSTVGNCSDYFGPVRCRRDLHFLLRIRTLNIAQAE